MKNRKFEVKCITSNLLTEEKKLLKLDLTHKFSIKTRIFFKLI